MPRVNGSTAARGYDWKHQQLRAWFKPQVEAGLVQCYAALCLMSSRWIQPGSPWDLGHTEDRTGWTGPEHARCNRAAGARKLNMLRGKPRRRRSRIW